MANQEVVDHLSQSMLVWACSVRRPEGYRVSQVLPNFNTQPFLHFGFILMNYDSGAEGEYIPLPGNDCAAPEQDGCCWQAGGIHTGVCFVEIDHGP